MPSFTVYKGSKDGYPKKNTTTKPDELSGDAVLVKITASGLCGTDLHYRSQDMVLGHEGVGVVEDVGPEVKNLKKGSRVGWGYNMGCCGHCRYCLQGDDVFCRDRALYGTKNLDQGSFASHAVWSEAFLHALPEGLRDEDAAPLQCGGATVFTALQGVQPGDIVAVMGVGGLGHLAIQFANKLGCRVVVLSGSDSKKDEATKLGAHKFIAMANFKSDDFDEAWKFDRLLVTTSAQPDWSTILPMMAPKSTIYPLSVSADDLKIPYMPILTEGIAIQGSIVATRLVHDSMLNFAAFHGVAPVVEKFPMSEEGIKAAMDKLEGGKVHFRAVLIAE